MIDTRTTGEAGFTLVEAMVALVVLAVASAGLIRATQSHVDTLRGLQRRVVAQWVAENRLVELGLDRSPPASGEQTVEMMGRPWAVRVASKPGADPQLAQVEISVRAPSETSALATLTGFIDTGRPSL